MENLIRDLSRLQPRNLWVSLDGPRNEDDKQKIEETRRIVDTNVDWDCSLRLNQFESNLGCRVGVAAGLDWFFLHNSEGVVLEDDLRVGDGRGLVFLEAMLSRFRADKNVFSISIDNSLGVKPRWGESYYLSSFPHVWGWATWREAWSLYDRDMVAWKKAVASGTVDTFFPDSQSKKFWSPLFDRVAYEPRFDSWAWCWAATHFANNGYCVQSSVNFVANVGFDASATHTLAANSRTSAQIASPKTRFREPKKQRETFSTRRQTYARIGSVSSRPTALLLLVKSALVGMLRVIGIR